MNIKRVLKKHNIRESINYAVFCNILPVYGNCTFYAFYTWEKYVLNFVKSSKNNGTLL